MARFDNENYRNWLKTTESLNTLRIGLRSFLENETETHHSSLQQELGHILKEATCQNKCDGKQWGKKVSANFVYDRPRLLVYNNR